MKLSKLEIKYLRRLAIAREGKEPSFRSMLVLSLPSWILLSILVTLATLWFTEVGAPVWGTLLIGMGIGTILRDIGWFRKSMRLWPLQRELINWDRVQELVTELDQPKDLNSALDAK